MNMRIIPIQNIEASQLINIFIMSPSIRILISLILDKYNDPELNLKMILKYLDFRKNFIYEICNRFLKMSIMELVRTIRIHKSIEFMFNDENKVWQKVGYKSIFVFSKAFKRQTGRKIQDVRRKFKNNNTDQNKRLYSDLIDKIWNERYEVFKELAGTIWQEFIRREV
jgi:AraC-like DNA-binding protein